MSNNKKNVEDTSLPEGTNQCISESETSSETTSSITTEEVCDSSAFDNDQEKAKDDCLKDLEDKTRVTLTDLPTEVIYKKCIFDKTCLLYKKAINFLFFLKVFLQVCSYLSARLLMQTLRLVSKRLNEILSDDFIWRSRIFKKWGQIYPPIPGEKAKFDLYWLTFSFTFRNEKSLNIIIHFQRIETLLIGKLRA